MGLTVVHVPLYTVRLNAIAIGWATVSLQLSSEDDILTAGRESRTDTN